HQYQACLSECQVSLHSETSCQVSLHSQTSVSSLSVRVPGLSPFRDISIKHHLSVRVPGLSPFRDISIKPVCQSARSLSIQRHQYQACLSECQVSVHSETSVSSLSVRVPGLSPFRDISIKPVCQSARSLSIQRHQSLSIH
uniref:Uncharacterized protein n=1 Tax=Oncorhynchus kisutch TaxID=8019 RepID=A0A8C7IQX8_ONCKI